MSRLFAPTPLRVGYRWPTGREVREAEDRAKALSRLRADPCVAEGMAGLEVNGCRCNPSRFAQVGDPHTDTRWLPWLRFMTADGPRGMAAEIRHTRGSRAAGW